MGEQTKDAPVGKSLMGINEEAPAVGADSALADGLRYLKIEAEQRATAP
jgi:hypothetical protein